MKRLNLTALRDFRKNFKSLEIPRNFIVPTNDPSWDRDIQGMDLGLYFRNVKYVLSNPSKLPEIPFAQINVAVSLGLDSVLDNDTKVMQLYLSTFRTYKKLYPNNDYVDRTFVINNTNKSFDKNVHGLALGKLYDVVKYTNRLPNIRDDIAALGFNLTYEKFGEHIDMQVFKEYYQNFDNLFIPQESFIIPADESKWSKKYHGFDYSHYLDCIKNDEKKQVFRFSKESMEKFTDLQTRINIHAKHLEKLKRDHEELEKQREKWAKQQAEARQIEQSQEKLTENSINDGVDNTRIPGRSDTQITPKTLPIPTSSNRLLTFSQMLQLVKQKNKTTDNFITTNSNVAPNSKNTNNTTNYTPQFILPFDTVYSALQAYKTLHNTNTNNNTYTKTVNDSLFFMPMEFCVPLGSEDFPDITWGMKLGETVDSIRHHGLYAENRVELKELGFVF